MPSDLPEEMQIGYSLQSLLVLFCGALILTVLGSAIVFHWFPGRHGIPVLVIIAGYVGLPLFGLTTLKVGWTLMTARGPMLFISRSGIRDLRLSKAFIPWESVTSVSSYETCGQKFVVLKVTPAMEKQLDFSTIRKLLRAMNNAFGAHGMMISPTGLPLDADRLLYICNEYYTARKPVGSSDGQGR